MRVKNKEIKARRHRKEQKIKDAARELRAQYGEPGSKPTATPKQSGAKKSPAKKTDGAAKPAAKKPAAPKAKKAEAPAE